VVFSATSSTLEGTRLDTPTTTPQGPLCAALTGLPRGPGVSGERWVGDWPDGEPGEVAFAITFPGRLDPAGNQ